MVERAAWRGDVTLSKHRCIPKRRRKTLSGVWSALTPLITRGQTSSDGLVSRKPDNMIRRTLVSASFCKYALPCAITAHVTDTDIRILSSKIRTLRVFHFSNKSRRRQRLAAPPAQDAELARRPVIRIAFRRH
ncbi:hypothetical protein EVAR_23064_1 [Eumeta japonica]|uniref:Uncharacterized protein n=1 Tax=Eumeta variegata TaxID=151549 RepID=A0A4C1VNK8_EUMVA|nr:hypothetical protein EVAR_23064_1 [Eumeta japonica]